MVACSLPQLKYLFLFQVGGSAHCSFDERKNEVKLMMCSHWHWLYKELKLLNSHVHIIVNRLFDI